MLDGPIIVAQNPGRRTRRIRTGGPDDIWAGGPYKEPRWAVPGDPGLMTPMRSLGIRFRKIQGDNPDEEPRCAVPGDPGVDPEEEPGVRFQEIRGDDPDEELRRSFSLVMSPVRVASTASAFFTNNKSVSRGRLQLQACAAATTQTDHEIFRPLADFPSDIWKDIDNTLFTSAASRTLEFDKIYGGEMEEVKNKVKEMLIAPTNEPAEKVSLINLISRLGVSYHFEAEIEEYLNYIFESQPTFVDDNDYDLFNVALLFRVFRQYGYKMSCGVFNKFKDSDGKFKQALSCDAKGLLSLYEATHLRIHGEDILDEALAFTTGHLKHLVDKTGSHLAKQITKALEMPLHKGIPRLEAFDYISIYGGDESNNENLLSWWRDTNLSLKLPYMRNRIMELYFWTVVTYYEPCYSGARSIYTKVLAMMTVMDDTFDAYGTLEELRRLTNAIERWDTSGFDELPDYMKIIYDAHLNLFDEIFNHATKEGRSYSVSCAKDTYIEYVRSYQVEAEWFNQSYVPPFEEYLSNAIISAACYAITATTFLGMGEMAGINMFEWLQSRPKLVKDAYTVGRLLDDIMTHKYEQKRGHVASAVECYMKQYGISEKETVEKIKKFGTRMEMHSHFQSI
ncbi:hypothetical protein ACOSQ4_017351 [Xanthoceras sorbifolium]